MLKYTSAEKNRTKQDTKETLKWVAYCNKVMRKETFGHIYNKIKKKYSAVIT